jgi:transcription elongation GreA/GreB family factor
MHITKLTGPMRRSLEARLLELEERVVALERQREADDSLDATALHRELSRERNQLADALAGAMLIDDDPFDSEAIEIGDTVTVRAVESGTHEQYVLVDGTVGSRARPDWVSTTSPLGAALVGRGKGDDVIVETPGGTGSYQVLDFGRNCDGEALEDKARRRSWLAKT